MNLTLTKSRLVKAQDNYLHDERRLLVQTVSVVITIRLISGDTFHYGKKGT